MFLWLMLVEILNVHSAMLIATDYTLITVKFCRPVSISLLSKWHSSPVPPLYTRASLSTRPYVSTHYCFSLQFICHCPPSLATCHISSLVPTSYYCSYVIVHCCVSTCHWRVLFNGLVPVHLLLSTQLPWPTVLGLTTYFPSVYHSEGCSLATLSLPRISISCSLYFTLKIFATTDAVLTHPIALYLFP